MLLWAIILHYLDDFFGILSSNGHIETYDLDFDILCVQLKMVVNHDKSIIGTLAGFFGIELNSILIRITLHFNKLARTRNIVDDLLNRAVMSHRELESVVGFLSFAAKIVIPERAFLRRLTVRRLPQSYENLQL